MQLHKVPNGTWIRVGASTQVPPSHRDFNEGEKLLFHHIDGMYSYCTDKDGKPVHVVAWAEVEVMRDRG